MPDVGRLLAAQPDAMIAHTTLHRGGRDCQRGIMTALWNFEIQSNTTSASRWKPLLIDYYLLLITSYLLLITHHLLLIAYYLLI